MDEELVYFVLSIVEEIPIGFVATYGQIAYLVDRPKNSRLIGKILSLSEYFGEYPCHRVVNHNGRIAPHFITQKELLLSEGITFKNEKCFDLKSTNGIHKKAILLLIAYKVIELC